MTDTTTALPPSETANARSNAARLLIGRIVRAVGWARASARTFFRPPNSGLTKQPATGHSKVDLMNRLETLALLAIFKLEPNARGVSISGLIEKTTKRRIAARKLYEVLNGLEDRGLICEQTSVGKAVGRSAPGPSPRHYEISPQGLDAIRGAALASQLSVSDRVKTIGNINCVEEAANES
jgi:hypothetical protein